MARACNLLSLSACPFLVMLTILRMAHWPLQQIQSPLLQGQVLDTLTCPLLHPVAEAGQDLTIQSTLMVTVVLTTITKIIGTQPIVGPTFIISITEPVT